MQIKVERTTIKPVVLHGCKNRLTEHFIEIRPSLIYLYHPHVSSHNTDTSKIKFSDPNSLNITHIFLLLNVF
jgi:hypothetical protein